MDRHTGNALRGNRWTIAVWGMAALLLLMPLVAMQFTDEMAWGPADFVIVAGMLLAACGAWELAVRMSGNTAFRAAVGLAVATAFLLIWMNFAVGLIGSDDNPANLIYGGVLALGLACAVVARFRPVGMARAMVATAGAQAVVLALVLVGAAGSTEPVRPLEVSALTALFVALWLGSALLFRKAAGAG